MSTKSKFNSIQGIIVIHSSSSGAKMGMCVLSNTCASLGLEVITRLEQRLEGLQWSNAATPLTADDPFHMGWVFFWLLLEIVVYMVIAW